MEHVLPSGVKITETQTTNSDGMWYGRTFTIAAMFSLVLCIEVGEFLDNLLGDKWRENTTIVNQVDIVYEKDAIAELKRQWRVDPNWDIETTEGFESHTDELLAYRLEVEAQHASAITTRLQAKAEKLGVPGNIQLATYIDNLENQIKALTARLDDIEDERNFAETVKLWSGK